MALRDYENGKRIVSQQQQRGKDRYRIQGGRDKKVDAEQRHKIGGGRVG